MGIFIHNTRPRIDALHLPRYTWWVPPTAPQDTASQDTGLKRAIGPLSDAIGRYFVFSRSVAVAFRGTFRYFSASGFGQGEEAT